MKKILYLSKGAECLIISDSSNATVKSIPFTAITEFSKHRGSLNDYLIIKVDNREAKIYYDMVHTPDTTDINDLFETIWGWIYTDTAPTMAPTTAAGTTA